jgi:ABC-2 type transport system ATP-binding protein
VASKTTTIKCLLNLIRPTGGEVKVFGLDPRRSEVPVKSRVAYVPDYVTFHPWMTVRNTLDYIAAFRTHWNQETERALLDQFRLDVRRKTTHLSKGQRTQLALICGICPICPEPELLVLHEPTSGLDPIVPREFIHTVIGAYQEGEPGRRVRRKRPRLLFADAAHSPTGTAAEKSRSDSGARPSTYGPRSSRETCA